MAERGRGGRRRVHRGGGGGPAGRPDGGGRPDRRRPDHRSRCSGSRIARAACPTPTRRPARNATRCGNRVTASHSPVGRLAAGADRWEPVALLRLVRSLLASSAAESAWSPRKREHRRRGGYYYPPPGRPGRSPPSAGTTRCAGPGAAGQRVASATSTRAREPCGHGAAARHVTRSARWAGASRAAYRLPSSHHKTRTG